MAKPTTVHEAKSARPPPYTEATLGKLSVEQRLITPEEARDLRAACHFDRQRSLRYGQVQRLVEEMSRGWFLAGTPIWFCVLPNRSMLLVNGNHTLEAVAESGIPVVLTCIYQKVASINEAGAAYACFDIQRVRSFLNSAQATGVGEGITGLTYVLGAVGIIAAGFSLETMRADRFLGASRRLRLDLVEEYRRPAELLHSWASGAPSSNVKILTKASVLSVALATAKYQPSAAEEFWRELLFDDGLKAGDPRKVMLRQMNSNTIARGSGNEARRYLVFLAAACWNAFFEGREVSHVKAGALVQFPGILGTPWAKKTVAAPTVKKADKALNAVGKVMDGRGASRAAAVYQPPA